MSLISKLLLLAIDVGRAVVKAKPASLSAAERAAVTEAANIAADKAIDQILRRRAQK